MEIVIPRLSDRHTKDYIQKIIAEEIGENLFDEELKEIMEEADKDADGYIGFYGFYRILGEKFKLYFYFK